MAADDQGEKTEQPTERRRQEAREEGKVPRSNDLNAAITLLCGLILLNVYGSKMYRGLLDILKEALDVSDASLSTLQITAARAGYSAATMLLPFLLLLLVITLGSAIAQCGLLLLPKKIVPQLSQLSPKKGLNRIFSTDSLTRTGMGLLKMLVIVGVGYYAVRDQIDVLLGTGMLTALGAMEVGGGIVVSLALRMTLALLILGLLDYFYQRWKTEKSLRMSKQEIKDEMKRMEGDPAVKSRRRQVQAKLAMQRISTEVPQADVVVTNPTEFAVALRYDESTMSAPRLVAKGCDWLAMRIRQIAQQHGVPIVQRPPLARGLYASVDVGEYVPPEYYHAVAEVLAYVYQLSGRQARAAAG